MTEMSSSPNAGGNARAQGGVVFRLGGELLFLPASIAMKVMPIPEMAHVPGGPIALRGVALVDGNMIPVVDLADDVPRMARSETAGAMLICTVLGECVGLVGIDVVATGCFETTGARSPNEVSERAEELEGRGPRRSSNVKSAQARGETTLGPMTEGDVPEEVPEEVTEEVTEVKFGEETARVLDVTGVIARVREGRWAV